MAELYAVILEALDFSPAANPVSGYPGSKVTNIQNDDHKSAGGVCLPITNQNRRAIYQFNPTDAVTANSAVQATITGWNATNYLAVAGRIKSTTEYYWGRHVNGTAGIYKHTTALVTAASAGDGGLLYMEFEDDYPSAGHTTIRLFIGGALICSYDDATPIGNAGSYKHGWGGVNVTSPGTSIYLDDVKVLWGGVNYPTNVAASDGTYKTKVAVTYTPNGSANPTSWYRSLTNDSAAAVLVASGVTGGTYNDYPPESGPAHKYYYFGKSELGGGSLSPFSTGDVGWRDSGDPCPADAVTDLGTYMSATLDEDHNIALVDASDPNLDLDVLGLVGIEIEASGTLTFDSAVIAPVIAVELWGVLLK